MLISGRGNEARFTFKCDAYPDGLEVYSVAGSEGMSQLYSFQIQLVSQRRDIKADQILDKEATLTIKGQVEDRHVKGIITSFDIVGQAKQRTIYQATLAPPHVRLGLTQRLRVFQDKTTRDIVTQVLKDCGITEGLEWKLKGTYTARNYCVQYRETDLAFLLRLLEEDGVAFHFEHVPKKKKEGEEGREGEGEDEEPEIELKTIFTDDNASFEPISDPATLPYCPDRSMVPDSEYVSSFTTGEQLTIGKVQLRDFKFKQPQTTMEAKTEAKTTGPATAEYYDYPAEFVETSLGDQLAKVRLESLQADKLVGSGSSDCNRFIAGRKFTLERHPIEAMNQEYLLVQVSCQGTQPHVMGEEGSGGDVNYGNSFTVIPATTAYRPPRRTPRPVVLGPCSATVVGPRGEEIYVDKYGRVKVQFHWDREGEEDERSSCWIRVSHPWAGAGYGAVFLPRVGHEVVVMFLEGDPDRPLIIGRVYNGENAHPYPLPGSKTVSTIKSSSSPGGGGYNELRFEDKKGAEEVFVHAQLNYNLVVNNDRTSSIGHNRTECVGYDQAESIGHNCSLLVGNYSLHKAREILTEAADKITLKVGKTTIELTPRMIKDLVEGLIDSKSTDNTDINGYMVEINPGEEQSDEEQNDESKKKKKKDKNKDKNKDKKSKKLPSKCAGMDVKEQPNGDVKVGDSIVIKGDRQFQQQTLQDLDRVDQTAAGHQKLQSIDSSGRSVTIQPTTGGNNNISTTAGNLRPDGSPGRGSDSTIGYNPNRTTTGPEPWGTRDPGIGLGHELEHADQAAHGTMGSGNVSNFGQIDPSTGAPAMVDRAEIDAVNFENSLRSQWNPPQTHRNYY